MKAPWSGEHSPPPAGRVGATPQRPSARAAWVLCLPLGLALPGVYYLLLVTGPSLRGLKDTGDFWGHCAWRFLRRHRAHRASLWGETWAGMSSPRPWHGEVCFCRKLLIPAAREPGAHLPAPAPRTGAGTWWGGGGDGGGGGHALLYQRLQSPNRVSTLRRKGPLLARGTQARLLGTISRTGFAGETSKEPRIKLLNADAFLFTQ